MPHLKGQGTSLQERFWAPTRKDPRMQRLSCVQRWWAGSCPADHSPAHDSSRHNGAHLPPCLSLALLCCDHDKLRACVAAEHEAGDGCHGCAHAGLPRDQPRASQTCSQSARCAARSAASAARVAEQVPWAPACSRNRYDLRTAGHTAAALSVCSKYGLEYMWRKQPGSCSASRISIGLAVPCSTYA